MVLWFAGLSVVAVWLVFRSPGLDYRLVILGAVAPVAEVAVGGPWVLHTLVGSVALLAVVMVATRGRRLVRRRLLGLPIGTFLHLALDGVWARTELFWWPLFGLDLGSGSAGAPAPELDRGGVLVAMELAGALALAWCWRRFELGDPARRAAFWHSGQLGRDLAA